MKRGGSRMHGPTGAGGSRRPSDHPEGHPPFPGTTRMDSGSQWYGFWSK